MIIPSRPGRKLPAVILFLSTLLAGGCSTVPHYENEKKPGDAELRAETPQFGKVFGGDAMMSVDEIDHQRTKIMKRGMIYFLRPGKHELGVTIASDLLFKTGRQFIELEAAGDHKYLLRPTTPDNDYTVEIIDETDAKNPKVINTVRVRAGAAQIFPIPIPIK
jgi:hypothetical protein